MWTWNWIDDLAKDIHHTVRMLSANPLFSAVAVLTLALGIGANTAIFSVANAILLRTLPVHDARRVFFLHVEPGQPDGAGNTGNGNSSFSARLSSSSAKPAPILRRSWLTSPPASAKSPSAPPPMRKRAWFS